MNFLFLSHTFIGSPYVVGSHHYSRELAKMGHKVLHVSHPISKIHKLLGKSRDGVLEGKVQTNLWQFTPEVILPIKIISKFSKKNIFSNSIAKQIKLKMSEYNISSIDVCLIDDPYFHGVDDYLNIGKYIYRPTDIYRMMKGNESVVKIEQNLLKSVSGIIATNKKINDFLDIDKTKVWTDVIENGFELEHFLKSSDGSLIKEKNSFKNGCYVGAVDHRFDSELLIYMGESCSNVHVDIYSPVDPNIKSKKIHYKGAASYEELPEILKCYDFLLMPFNFNSSNHSRSPMKLFEYAATKLPIIMPNYLNDYGFDGVYLYGDKESFIDKVNHIKKGSLFTRDKYILEENSWSNKTNKLFQLVSNRGGSS